MPLAKLFLLSQPSVPAGSAILNAFEFEELNPGADAVSTQPDTAAAAVLLSVVNFAKPLASVVALPEIAHAAELTIVTNVADGATPPCSNLTVTGLPAELNGLSVMIEPGNASVGCLSNPSVHDCAVMVVFG